MRVTGGTNSNLCHTLPLQKIYHYIHQITLLSIHLWPILVGVTLSLQRGWLFENAAGPSVDGSMRRHAGGGVAAWNRAGEARFSLYVKQGWEGAFQRLPREGMKDERREGRHHQSA